MWNLISRMRKHRADMTAINCEIVANLRALHDLSEVSNMFNVTYEYAAELLRDESITYVSYRGWVKRV